MIQVHVHENVWEFESPLRHQTFFSKVPQKKVLLSHKDLPSKGQIAQLVEQRTENPCVGGSIPPLATSITKCLRIYQFLENPFVRKFVRKLSIQSPVNSLSGLQSFFRTEVRITLFTGRTFLPKVITYMT